MTIRVYIVDRQFREESSKPEVKGIGHPNQMSLFCICILFFATVKMSLIIILICVPTQVAIQADLEKKIIKLINDFRQENGDKGPISGRLTNKKLLVKGERGKIFLQ